MGVKQPIRLAGIKPVSKPLAIRLLQSFHACIRREARGTRTLRNYDGRSTWTIGGDAGCDHGCNVISGATRHLLPEPAPGRKTGDGYPDCDEKPYRCERAYSECDGRIEEKLTTEHTDVTL